MTYIHIYIYIYIYINIFIYIYLFVYILIGLLNFSTISLVYVFLPNIWVNNEENSDEEEAASVMETD